jgi:hypothetical protein
MWINNINHTNLTIYKQVAKNSKCYFHARSAIEHLKGNYIWIDIRTLFNLRPDVLGDLTNGKN